MNFQEIMIKLGVDGSAIGAGLSGVTNRVKSWSWTIKETLKNTFSGTAIGNMGQSVGHTLAKTASFGGKMLRPVVTPIISAIPFRRQLSQLSATVRAQMTSMGAQMKHGIGHMLTGFLVFSGLERLFEGIKEQIIEISRLSEDTGASTNFIQSIMLQAKIAGESVEGMIKPIIRFNQLIGAAKQGDTSALKKLSDLGIASNRGEANAIGYEEAMKKLKATFDKTGDAAKKDAILFDAFGKSAFKMSGIFRQSSSEFNKMFEGNFFTKISAESIDTMMDIQRGSKTLWQSVVATGANALNFLTTPFKKLSQAIGILSTGQLPTLAKLRQIDKESIESNEKKAKQDAVENMAAKDGLSVEEEKVKIQEHLNSLIEKQATLQADIADRDKESVKELADKARRLTGIKSPLEQSHTVTARMRAALKIDTLEEKSKLEFERGHDDKSKRLQSEADQIRASSPWLKRNDRNPMAKTEMELKEVNSSLEPVKRMAELVNSQASK